MKKLPDIKTSQDVISLVDLFYEKVKQDRMLAPFFESTNWSKHIPIMYKFWENIILHSGEYTGNPMSKHQHLHRQRRFQRKHFARWEQLFTASVNDLYSGPNAVIAIKRSKSIGEIIMLKMT